jgi:NAD(P)H-hydrate epimerase
VLPARPSDAHKGTFGTALIIAGSTNYTGAVLLAAEAAYRIGTGLVTCAIPEPLHSPLAGQLPEATWLILPHDAGVIAPGAADIILKHTDKANAILIGPGFGLENCTAQFMEKLLSVKSSQIGFLQGRKNVPASETILPPTVLDADGLKILAKLPDWPTLIPPQSVLTPHPGEMSVLTGLSKEAIQADRLAIARHYSQEWGHVIILKGAFSIIAAPTGDAAVIPVASPALARAGTGDVLSGLVVGLRAQGVSAFQAAVASAYIHAQAGLKAAKRLGHTAAVLAGDIVSEIPAVLVELFQ